MQALLLRTVLAVALLPVHAFAQNAVVTTSQLGNHQNQADVAAMKHRFSVTSGEKTELHPFFEKGSKMGFAVNGVLGKELVLTRGLTYIFDVDTSIQHDFYFSTRAKGWGAGTVTEGISGQFVYKGEVEFRPNEQVPGRIFYACRNHKYMGGLVHVIDEGETVVLEGLNPDLDKPIVVPVTADDVNQKIARVKALLIGQGVENVKHGTDSSAKGLLRKANTDVSASETALKAGNLDAAMLAANAALDTVNKAIKMVPERKAEIDHRSKYDELLESVNIYKASYEQQYTSANNAGDKSLDPNVIQAMHDQALELSEGGQYAKANELLTQAQEMLVTALTSVFDGTEVVYDKNFQTPLEEYEYELARFKEYERLVPMAIEKRRPRKTAIQFMNRYLEKGQTIAAEAQDIADKGDHATAVLGLQEATKQIQKALVAAGVR